MVTILTWCIGEFPCCFEPSVSMW